MFGLLLDNCLTLFITFKKSVLENSPKMSSKIHPKSGLLVDTRIHQKRPREFTHFILVNLHSMSTRSPPHILVPPLW